MAFNVQRMSRAALDRCNSCHKFGSATAKITGLASVNARRLTVSAARSSLPAAPRQEQQQQKQGKRDRNDQQRSGKTFLRAGAGVVTAAGAAGGTWLTLEGWEKPKESSNKSQYATVEEMEQAVAEIEKLLGEESISIEDDILQSHGYSEWSTVNVERLPVAVAFPKNTEEVVAIAKICHRFGVPIIPYSGGSSVEGHFSAPHGGISVDFMNMSQIVKFRPEDMDITVQPGMSWMEMNKIIADSGLFFPIDPGPSAQLGGMIGTNCSGTNAVRYGTMRDWVVNLTVVLADGTVIKTRRRPRKSSAGYNLNSLFVGSEGTLGLVTEATLKLTSIPESTAVAVISFPNIKTAADLAVSVMQNGIPVGAIEILDDVQMRVINQIGATGRTWEEKPTLFIKFAGDEEVVKHNISKVQKIAKNYESSPLEFETEPEKQKQLWSARKEALWSMLALRETNGGVWTTDTAVPLSRVAELIEISKKDLVDLNIFASVLGHVGDGNFHETILFNGEEERKLVSESVHRMVDRALEMEGTCTGEHGIGLGKIDALEQELGTATIEVMRAIKKSLDPKWLMNPGKIFRR